jgi:hypothetical protein
MSVTFSCSVKLYRTIPSLSLYDCSSVRLDSEWMYICCSSAPFSSGSMPCLNPPSMTSHLLLTMPTKRMLRSSLIITSQRVRSCIPGYYPSEYKSLTSYGYHYSSVSKLFYFYKPNFNRMALLNVHLEM